MKILFTGGGTLGSVSPLLAVAQNLQQKTSHLEFLWVGTKNGPETDFVSNCDINYAHIPQAKLRRYFSLKNIVDCIKLSFAFFKSIIILLKFKPDIIIGAGGFTQVPIIYASKLVCRAKIIIHQQDIKTGLSNKLCTKFADKITLSIKEQSKTFPHNKTVFTGNPFRQEILHGNVAEGIRIFKLKKSLPTLLILGGGTGAMAINQLVAKSVTKITAFCQIIHIAGFNKTINIKHKRYHQFNFLNKKLKHALAVSDIIVSRAGFSTLTELSVLAKTCIVIPIPDSHQEKNALFFSKQNAILNIPQKNLTPVKLIEIIKNTMDNQTMRFKLSSNISKITPKNAVNNFVQEIGNLMEKEIQIKKW